MNYTHEKIFLGIFSLASSGMCTVGAIISTGDTRWFCVTLAVSLITSCLLALMFKKPDETIQLVAGRCGISILGGVFLTKLVAWYFNITIIHTDVVALGGLTCAVCIGVYILGFKALRYLEKRSDFLAKKFIDGKVSAILGPDGQSADGDK